ncbi:uncharacterized protein C1orf50 homolog [Agrilus planipennis]|uniref:Uncharacterized protein C1orf50 homolog n=1 Tax=Agrilus planipennis TaxID=224129 RepID=A0A7F5R366_AGRPL|nr:uncharacterized protein C1orf50 homolog [Agrilus planipennis]
MKRNFEMADNTKLSQNEITLVERDVNPYGIALVNPNLVAKRGPSDLVQLAEEIQKADTMIHATAYNKLQVIAEQIKFLQKQAQKILLDAKTNKDLHHAACNFVKIPGNIYHLYERLSGQQYFSLVAPEEWSNCPHKHLGSFRLEQDHSWTPVNHLETKNKEIEVIGRILASSDVDYISNAIEQGPLITS